MAILILATQCKHTSISMDSAKDEIVTFQSVALCSNWPGPSFHGKLMLRLVDQRYGF